MSLWIQKCCHSTETTHDINVPEGQESREAELRALTAPEVREAVARAGVELRGYATL